MDIALVATGTPENDTFPVPKYGTSIQIWGLAQEFRKAGHDVTIYSSTHSSRNTRIEEGVRINELSTTRVDSKLNGMFSKLNYSRKLAHEIQSDPPDVVFLRERFTSVFPVRLDIPTVYTLISPDALDFFYEFSISVHQLNRILFRYKQAIEYHACRNSDANIVMNKRVCRYLKRRDMGPNHLIPIGIRRDDFGGEYNTNRKRRILFVGRFDENKRPGWAIDAYAALDLDFELHLVGSGKNERVIKERVDSLGQNVITHGRVPRNHVLELMENSSIVLLPSKFDNSPNVVLEGMAAGCAVLASNSAGAQYMINHSETGMLFDRNCKKDMFDKLQQLADDRQLRHRLGQDARRYAFDNHGMDVISQKYLSVAREIIE